jgi:hypothetical protein
MYGTELRLSGGDMVGAEAEVRCRSGFELRGQGQQGCGKNVTVLCADGEEFGADWRYSPLAGSGGPLPVCQKLGAWTLVTLHTLPKLLTSLTLLNRPLQVLRRFRLSHD